MEKITYHGWEDSIRVSNGRMELVVTTVVGPRIVRCGFCGGTNLFASIPEEQGGRGEAAFRLRGGHRFWLAPEDMAVTYEPDNVPVTVTAIPGGVHLLQETGPLSGCRKELFITMESDADRVRVEHRVTNQGTSPRKLAP
ncbi:MAG: hypothetical protein ACNA71_09840, partial [Kiritimatiellia bacterium]